MATPLTPQSGMGQNHTAAGPSSSVPSSPLVSGASGHGPGHGHGHGHGHHGRVGGHHRTPSSRARVETKRTLNSPAAAVTVPKSPENHQPPASSRAMVSMTELSLLAAESEAIRQEELMQQQQTQHKDSTYGSSSATGTSSNNNSIPEGQETLGSVKRLTVRILSEDYGHIDTKSVSPNVISGSNESSTYAPISSPSVDSSNDYRPLALRLPSSSPPHGSSSVTSENTLASPSSSSRHMGLLSPRRSANIWAGEGDSNHTNHSSPSSNNHSNHSASEHSIHAVTPVNSSN